MWFILAQIARFLLFVLVRFPAGRVRNSECGAVDELWQILNGFGLRVVFGLERTASCGVAG